MNSLLHFQVNEVKMPVCSFILAFSMYALSQKNKLVTAPVSPNPQRHLQNLPTAHMCVTQMSSPPLAVTASDFCSVTVHEKRTVTKKWTPATSLQNNI